MYPPYLFKYYLLKIDTFYYSSFTIFRTYSLRRNQLDNLSNSIISHPFECLLRKHF